MEFGPASFVLGYGAGVLSTLSPCVLPLVPILIASALSQHRFGPLALAAGLTLSFTVVGLFIATIGVSIGLDQSLMREVAAVLLISFGSVLLSTRLQHFFTRATAGIGASGSRWLGRLTGEGWFGQFAVGLLLGLVWVPCVGPTLGAASTLAAQGSQLSQVALLMLVFGLGAATPLVILGIVSRTASQRWRGKLMAAGAAGKLVFGTILLAVGVAIVTGVDKRLETFAVDISPQWLTALTTRF
ncbi:MAG: cytochrome c biogenesis CcdA family protein [Caldimonas sp.]